MTATNSELQERYSELDGERAFVRTLPFNDAARFVSGAMRHGSGLYLITGPVGAGKSLVLEWCRQDAPDHVIHVSTSIRRVDFDNLSRFLSHVLRVQQAPDITPQALALRYFLKLGTLRTKGMRFVVLLDNVEEIHSGGAELLKALLQMKDDTEPLVTVILSGDSALAALLDGSFRWGIHKLIRQSHQMTALTVEQTLSFVNELPSPEDGIQIPVTAAAAKQIHRECQGIPRRISRLADSARRIARHAGASRVTPRMVRGAIDGSYQPLGSAVLSSGWKYGAVLLVLLLVPLFPLRMDRPVVHLADSPPLQLQTAGDGAPSMTPPTRTGSGAPAPAPAAMSQAEAGPTAPGTVPATVRAGAGADPDDSAASRWNRVFPAMALREDGIGMDGENLPVIPVIPVGDRAASPTQADAGTASRMASGNTALANENAPQSATAGAKLFNGFSDRIPPPSQ